MQLGYSPRGHGLGLIITAWTFFIALALAPASAQAAVIGEQVDQSLLISSPTQSFAVSNNQQWGQTFTAGMPGYVTRVDLQIGRQAGATPLGLEIRKTVGSVPDLTPAGLLFSTTIDPNTVPIDSFPLAFTVACEVAFGSVPVSPGDKLAIIASNASSNWYLWSSSTANPYASGTALHRFTAGGTWTAQSATDSGFQTWVAVPEPTGALPIIVGIIAMARCRSRQRWPVTSG